MAPTHPAAQRLLGWKVVLLLSAVVGCRESEARTRYGPPELSHGEIPLLSSTGTVLSESPLLGLPSDIATVGRFVVALDLASDSVVHVFDAATGAHTAQLGRRGEGPCEFKTAWTLSADPDDSNFLWVYDIGLLRMTRVDVERSVRDRRLACTNMITLGSEAVPTGPIWLEEDRLVSLGFFPTGRLGFFDSEGNHVQTAGDVPAGDGSMDVGIWQHAYQATLTRNSSGNLVAAATRHASVLEIYTFGGKLVANVEGPLTVTPQFGVGRSVRGLSIRTGADLRFGYVDVTADSERIYALFSGRTREGYPKSAFQGRFIHVFDWRGSFETAVELAAEVVSIYLDEPTGSILAIRHDPTPALLRFSFNNEKTPRR